MVAKLVNLTALPHLQHQSRLSSTALASPSKAASNRRQSRLPTLMPSCQLIHTHASKNLCCPGEARPGSPVLQPVRCRASSPDFMTWGPALPTTQQFQGAREERASLNTHSTSCKLLLYEGKHQASSSFWPQLQYGDLRILSHLQHPAIQLQFFCQQRTFPKFFRCNPLFLPMHV